MAQVSDDETRTASWLNQPGSSLLDFDRMFGARGAADMSHWRAPVVDAHAVAVAVSEPGGAAPAADPQRDGATASVGLTGDARIDGLLSLVKWADGTITYAFPENSTDFESGYPSNNPNLGFGQLTVAQQAVYHNALNTSTVTTGPGGGLFTAVEGFTNLGITSLFPTGNATLRAAYSTDPGSSAYAYYPSTNFYGGDAWYGTNSPRNYQAPVLGGDAYRSTFHEIGHQLGLKHGHEGSNGNNTIVPDNYNSHEYTLMTYRSYVGHPGSGGYTNETYGHPQSWMMLDIAALQHMYGADFTHNGGSTTYTWSTTTGQMFVNGVGQGTPGANRIFLTIWDGNGNDTYDLSNYSSNLEIDLSPGGYSDFNSGQSAYIGGSSNAGYARGNVFNALQFNGDARSLIENAIGGSGNDTINGNAANNGLYGNAGNDSLYGYAGEDVLSGGAGEDYLKGGGGSDALYGGNDNDTLKGGGEADTLDGGAGIDTVTYDDSSAAVSIILGAGSAAGSGFGGTAQGDVLYNIENVTGSGYNDSLTGNALANVLNGGGGADTMTGGAGNDTYYVDDAGDRTIESAGQGTDLVIASITHTLANNVENLTLGGSSNINGFGNALANKILGNDGNNVLNGKTGADDMRGGLGNDTYYVDNAGDKTVEYGGGGTDRVISTITHTLAGNVENLTLTGTANINGTGNNLANIIAGNAGNNVLNGKAGADRMVGGAGNDTYYVDNAGDTAVEAANGGTDRVISTVSFTLGANVETLTLTGTGNLNGTGNATANTITGTVGNNVLNGKAGADRMVGGDGNDTYYVDNAGDLTVEYADGGTDRVLSTVSFTLSNYVENLTLTGSANINGTGNALANVIVGNSGNNVLKGGLGNDTLTGGAGNDTFHFDKAASSTNLDRILDFNVADDRIWLEDTVFTALDLGALDAAQFANISSASAVAGADQRILYNQSNGYLYYDADGGSAAGRVQIAWISNKAALTHADFFVV
ncbi:M10 family metallopeptidase C-terminal domain-containing protein [Enterovirga rhinocerotis]|uniref:Ca2+-binding RTX toxin-like protein n=1 Tax=Enterovirga rhinocerotis TaxID=1339210 RepID=A0A4R7C8J7_9HYPH|nr:M10 family metallopeptidase C-terminal domain-containing protein [Enterovirga rhinocerotis]TDR94974.1 Ca2+-binding RTX toxin-like protein [Enterovirga rhinocerotis]